MGKTPQEWQECYKALENAQGLMKAGFGSLPEDIIQFDSILSNYPPKLTATVKLAGSSNLDKLAVTAGLLLGKISELCGLKYHCNQNRSPAPGWNRTYSYTFWKE